MWVRPPPPASAELVIRRGFAAHGPRLPRFRTDSWSGRATCRQPRSARHHAEDRDLVTETLSITNVEATAWPQASSHGHVEEPTSTDRSSRPRSRLLRREVLSWTETKLGPGVRLTPTGAIFERELSFQEWADGLKYLGEFYAELEREMAWLHSLRFCSHCGKQLPEGSTSRRLCATTAVASRLIAAAGSASTSRHRSSRARSCPRRHEDHDSTCPPSSWCFSRPCGRVVGH